MSINANELKQCTRCHSTILLQYFDTNRKGELFKTCRTCLTRDTATDRIYYEANKDYIKLSIKTWKENHKEQHLAQTKKYKEENKDYISETLSCPCGSSHVRYAQARHLRTIKHIKYLEQLALIPEHIIGDAETS